MYLNRRFRPLILLFLSLVLSLLVTPILATAGTSNSPEQPDAEYQQLNQSVAAFVSGQSKGDDGNRLDNPLSTLDYSQNVEFVEQVGGAVNAAAVRGNHVYIGNGPRLVILDITIPSVPYVVGKSSLLQGVVQDVAIAGDYAYVVAGGGGLRIINVSNPKAPTETGFYDTPGTGKGVAVAGDYAYVAAGGGGLRIINVSNPAAPIETGFYQTPGDARAVAVAGNYAYVADYRDGLRIINITDPAVPFETGFWPGIALDVAVAGSYAYVAGYDSGLRIIDVANPAHPVGIGFWDTLGLAHSVVVAGNYAYIADFIGLQIINVADPTKPRPVDRADTSGYAYGVAVEGNYAYIAEYDGLSIFNVADPYALTRTAFYGTFGNAKAVVVDGNYAYVAGFTSGLHIINVVNPAAPAETGFYEKSGDTGVHDEAVAGNYAYVAAAYSGLRIVDVTNPTAPTEIGFLEPGHPIGVTVAGNYAYVVSSSGLHIIDVADPYTPIKTGFYNLPQYVTAVAVAVDGNYAYVCSQDGWVEDGLRIINVADPAAPIGAGFYQTPGSANSVAVDGNYAYVADDTGGLRIINVANPAAPFEAGFFDTPGSAQGIAVDGKYAYVADGSAGLRIINIANPANPIETGFYDTPGSAQGVAVDGNIVYVADHDGGLFILRYLGPVLDVDPDRIDISGKPGEPLAKTINVLELGGVDGIQGISIFATDLTDDANNTIPGNSINFDPAAFDLSAGGNQMVTMRIPLSGDLPTGIFSGSVTVESLNDGTKSIPITINVGLGSITIKKQTDPAGVSSFSFDGDLGSFSLYGGESKVFNGLTADDYAVIEKNSTGWFLDSVDCDSENVSSNGNGRTIHLEAGEDISCTFVNHRLSVTAKAGGPYMGFKGSPIALDASGTINKELVTIYIWDCMADGTVYEVSSSPTASACTYEEGGEYTVKLQTIDIFERLSTDTAEVIVTGMNTVHLPMIIRP